MTERRFFLSNRDGHTEEEWHEVVAFLARYQLDPHNIPAGEQVAWDADAGTIVITEWIRNEDTGNLRLVGANQIASREVTIHTHWPDLPTAWQRAAL